MWAIRTLTRREQYLVFMRFWQGKSLKSMAEDSQMNYGTIRSRLTRIYAKLRVKVSEQN